MYDLSPAELRVLGSLLEKQRTTPDTYPLTLNGLRAACNQATNRDPVVQYDDETIRNALHQLGKRRWTRLASGHGSRAAKYRHLLEEELRLGREEQALLAALMLRGSQTPGELLQRTERLYHFGTAEELHATLDRLIERDLVVRLSRRPGQREERYAHLLGGEAPDEETEAAAAAPVSDDRLDRIERDLADLRAQVRELREMLTGSGQ
ncbi:MAG TPA: YceH family protein [Solirubrobacteraceae bacterium]